MRLVGDPDVQVRTNALKHASVRNFGVDELRDNILDQRQPPVDHRLVDRQRAQQQASAASRAPTSARPRRTAHRLDPTRPVGQAVASDATGALPEALRAARHHRLQRVLRLVPGAQRLDRRPRQPARLPRQDPRAAIRTRRSWSPRSAPRPTATARSRSAGPTSSSRRSSTSTSASSPRKPWLSGATWWALQEFRVRPDWDGGNPRPEPPFHQKGLITLDRRQEARVLRRPADLPGTEQFPPGDGSREAGTPEAATLTGRHGRQDAEHQPDDRAPRARALAGHPPAAPRGPRARRALRPRRATAVLLGRRARAAPRAPRRRRRARADRRRHRHHRRRAQGRPAPPRPRRGHAHRPAARRPQQADPRARAVHLVGGRGRARHQGGRRARARHPRDHRRGAAERDPRVPRLRRLRDGDQRHGRPWSSSPRPPASRSSTTPRPSSPTCRRRASRTSPRTELETETGSSARTKRSAEGEDGEAEGGDDVAADADDSGGE